MGYENIIYEKDGDAIGIITVNRPKTLNALNTATLKELEQALYDCHRDKSLKVLIITGAGDKSFIAGADIEGMTTMGVFEARDFSARGHRVLAFLEAMKIPIIAAVNGFALGGGTEFCLACDLVYASEKAKFGQPEVKLGLIPGFGGCQRLPRLLGKQRAKELIYIGMMIDAYKAKEIGLVLDVFPHDKLMDEVKRIARQITEVAPIAVAQSKGAIEKGYDLELSVANHLEQHYFAVLFGTEDTREGLKAFVEKRSPKFIGK